MKSLRHKEIICVTLFSLLLAACGGGGDSGGGSSGGGTPPPGGGTGGGGSGGGSGGGGSGGGSSTVSVGGTVQGIQSGQVAISNQGDDSRTISGNNNFTFTVDQGTAYEIVVDVNPLEQLCRVENGSSSSAAATTDIQVICQPVAEATSCQGNADSDGDSLTDCQELERHFTNPWIADTDGDSYDDGREAADYDPNNNRFVFNPRVADMALIAIELTSVPEIDLDFTESSGTSRTVATSYEQSETNSISQNWGGEVSRQLEIGHTFSVSTQQTIGAEVSVGLSDIGATGSYESSLSLGFEASTTQTRGSSVNWSRAATDENSRAYSETLDLTEEQNSTYNGGFLRVTARVVNDGHIPYDLENLTLSAVLFDPKRPFDIESIGTMEFSDGGFPPTTILSGESAPLNFSTELTLGKAQTLLRDSENIVIEPGTFRLLDINDQSLLLVDRDVSARTATIIIDYGINAAREDKFRVSVNRGDGSRTVTLADALSGILGLSIAEGAGNWIYGMDTSPSSTPSGVLQIGAYTMNADTNSYWLLAHNRTVENGNARTTDYYNLLLDGYNLNDIQLRAGDKVNLVYVSDNDRDAISNRLEREIGTDEDLYDTDGDTLNDGLEVYGWLTNLTAPPCDQGELTRVYGNPFLADSDDDGVNDAQEKENCENPSFDFTADAGEEQFVNMGMMAQLNGNYDGIATGTPTYVWVLLSGPDVEDSNGDMVRELEGRQPSFTAPDQVTSLVWELQATINGITQTDTTVVQVQQDRQAAVYVGIPNGPSDGTREHPYATISEALSAIDVGDDLYVMTQETPYTLVNRLNIPDGTSLFGGYNQDWIRDLEQPGSHTPIIREVTNDSSVVFIGSVGEEMWFSGFNVMANDVVGVPSNNGQNDVVALEVISTPEISTAPLYVTDNILTASDVLSGASQTPGSSYAARFVGLSTLRLVDNTLNAGIGGRGESGASGSTGADGNDASGRTRGSGNPGPNGGNGGNGGAAFTGGDSGAPGTAGTGGASAGTAGQPGDGLCKPGGVGGHGSDGDAGADGAKALQPTYSQLSLGYVAPNAGDGAKGDSGAGGGGGAGGDGCGSARGGNGGGGGEAGEGGFAGIAGVSAGASIGVWLEQINNAELRRNQINAADGGAAGAGGRGGNGGTGGDYANGSNGGTVGFCPVCDRGAAGGRGGDGGNGGRGGHGGGGLGGPSFGIFVAPNISPLLFDNIIQAGRGGQGGSSYMFAGDGGASFVIFDADINDGALPELVSGNTLNQGNSGTAGSGILGGTAGDAGEVGQTNFGL